MIRKKYFKILHYKEGELFDIYGVVTDGSLPHEINFYCYGDEVKYYEPITKAEYVEIMEGLK